MRTPRTRWPGIGSVATVAAVALLFAWSGASKIFAEQYESDFDGPGNSWQIRCRETDAKLTIHERRRDAGHRGGAEFVRLKVARDNIPLRFEHNVPTVRVLDELEASLWVRSDRAGAVLALRIGFRGLTDPETGGPLSTIVTGDAYQTPGQWQQLRCRTSDKAVNDQLRLLRAQTGDHRSGDDVRGSSHRRMHPVVGNGGVAVGRAGTRTDRAGRVRSEFGSVRDADRLDRLGAIRHCAG